jgi:cytochrome P450
VNPALPLIPHKDSRGVQAALMSLPGPIDRVVLFGELPVWMVTGYGHVRRVLADDQLVKDPLRLPSGIHPFAGRRYPEDGYALGGRHLVSTDSPDHERLRRITQPEFSRRAMRRRRPLIEETTRRRLSPLLARGEAELVTDFVQPVLNDIICHLIGIPDHGWDTALAGSLTLLGAPHPESRSYRDVASSVQALIVTLLEQRRAEPASDVATVAAAAWSDGQVTRREAVGLLRELISANMINTIPVIARGVISLLSRPELAEALVGDAALAERVTEELLRLASPNAIAPWRFAPRPMSICGTQLATGDIVMAATATANHDRPAFPNPDQLVPGRGGPAHLAFGRGPHYCLGAELARLETQIMLLTLAPLASRLELAVPEHALPWCATTLTHGLAAVPVTIRPRLTGRKQ